jgi:hypothetical protein
MKELNSSEDKKSRNEVKDSNKYSIHGTKHTFLIPSLQIARNEKYKK